MDSIPGTQSFLLALSALFSIVNPLGSALIFSQVTADRSHAERLNIARRIGFYSALVMLGALWGGAYILAFFGVSLAALRIAGGVFVATLAWSLLQAPETTEERKQEQDFIDTAVALTEDEVEEKEVLAQEGFGNWNRREFQIFVRGCERYGRRAFALIAADMPDASKTEKEVREYSKVFWDRIDELSDSAKLIARIEEGESKLVKQQHQESVLRKKVSSYRLPLLQLKVVYGQNKGKSYSEEEDRFLLVKLAEYGLAEGSDTYDRIKKDVMGWSGFRFDWFIKSRTPQELGRRCNTLVLLVLKEMGEEEVPSVGGGAKKRKSGLDTASNAGSSRAGTPITAPGGPSKKKKK